MVTYPSLCNPCDLRDTMPRHWSPGGSHPNPLPREAEDFPRGDIHFKHVPPLNIPNLLITKRVIYGRSNLNLIAAQIPEESAPHEI